MRRAEDHQLLHITSDHQIVWQTYTSQLYSCVNMTSLSCVLFNQYLTSKSTVIIILNKQPCILDAIWMLRYNKMFPNEAITELLLLVLSNTQWCFAPEWIEWMIQWIFLFIKTASCIVPDWISVFEWIIWVNNKLRTHTYITYSHLSPYTGVRVSVRPQSVWNQCCYS